ncbi:MAG: fibronectin type III domain-containing protein [Saccharofermentanales bacterium]
MIKKVTALLLVIAMCLSIFPVFAIDTVTAAASYNFTAKAVTVSGTATSAQVVVTITHSGTNTPDWYGPVNVVGGSYSVIRPWTTKPENDYTVTVENQDDYTTAATTFSSIKKYTVAFDSQGGSPVTSKVVIHDTVTAAPASPARTGYTFAGWFKEAGCINEWQFATEKVVADMTLYAKWSVIVLTVSFNSMGGSYVADKSADYDTLITPPAAPTRSGYAFVGWYLDSTYKSPWVFASYKVTVSRTLYARWIASSVSGMKAAANTYNSLKLTWTAVPGASYYMLYRATSSTGTYTLVTTQLATSATYTNIGLATGTTYYFKVRAYAMIGTAKIYSNYSAVASAKVVPAAPAGLVVSSPSYNSLKLAWTAVAGANGYTVYRSTSKTGTYSALATLSTPYYTNASLSTGATYFYKVSAYRLVGTTKVYGAQCAPIGKRVVPATISSLTVVRYSSTGIKISWGAISGASGYEIYRSIASAGTYTLLKSQTALSYINTGLKTGTFYYYKVRTYRLVGTTKVYADFSAVKYAKP